MYNIFHSEEKLEEMARILLFCSDLRGTPRLRDSVFEKGSVIYEW